jgi:hypothetical protein
MNTSLFRTVTITALLSFSAAGLLAGPSQEFHKRKHAGRVAAQIENKGDGACCPMTKHSAEAKPVAKDSCCPMSTEAAAKKSCASACQKP